MFSPRCFGREFTSRIVRTGAIERAKLEQDEPDATPAITYERFVQDLDHGDSFTTTLVEILVKVCISSKCVISRTKNSTGIGRATEPSYSCRPSFSLRTHRQESPYSRSSPSFQGSEWHSRSQRTFIYPTPPFP